MRELEVGLKKWADAKGRGGAAWKELGDGAEDVGVL